MPSLGIEPRLRPSQGRVRVSTTLRGQLFFQYLARESNPVLQFRRLPCFHRTPKVQTSTTSTRQPTTAFAPASTCLQDRRLPQSSHNGNKHKREESDPARQHWRLAAPPGAQSSSPRNSQPSGRLSP